MSEDKKKLREAESKIYHLEEEVRELGNRWGNAEIGITAMRARAAGLEAENTALKDAIRLAAEKLDELARHFEATAREAKMKAESLGLRADSPAEAGEKDNKKELRDESLEMRGKRQECRFSQAAQELRKTAWNLVKGV